MSESQMLGFVGVGRMGGPMAANLVKAGHTVRGFDLSQPLLDEARGKGISPCASLAEAVGSATRRG